MRPLLIGSCLFAAACSDQAVNSPMSPTSATIASAQARSGTQLPFRGSFTGGSVGVVNCPPTCPPTTVRVRGNDTGEATHLGHFTATYEDVVDLATATGAGTFNLIAANGDQLFTATTGGEDPPNSSHVTLVATIVRGTGRFVAATGTFTIRRIGTVDVAAGTASESGSIEGQINMNK